MGGYGIPVFLSKPTEECCNLPVLSYFPNAVRDLSSGALMLGSASFRKAISFRRSVPRRFTIQATAPERRGG